jgi:hypothetical protein
VASLVSLLALIQGSAAWASDECGAPDANGKVVCGAAGSPYGDVDYNGADGLDLTLESGAAIEGSLTVLGDGAIKITAVPGSRIDGQITPALDIGSTTGTVDVTVDQVTGGLHGVAAVAGGDVTITANEVTASIAVQAESVDGNVVVQAAKLNTGGEGGAGVNAATGAGDVRVSVDEIHAASGLYLQGVIATSVSGDVDVTVGTIDLKADRSEGVRADSYSGDIDVKVNSITITGGETVGVSAINDTGSTSIDVGSIVTKGNVGRGIFASSFADIDVAVDYIETDGFIYDGAQLVSTEGDIKASAGEIRTKGDWSTGISAETGGSVRFDIGTVTTLGEYSDGVGAFAGGDVVLNVDSVETYGAGSSGIVVGTSGDQTISVGTVIAHGKPNGGGPAIGTGTFAGDIAIEVREAAISGRDAAIVTSSVEGEVLIAVREEALVKGKLGGIFADGGGGVRIDIAGTVAGGDGPALDIRGGGADVRVASTGIVRGPVLLTDADDLLANQGRMVLSGESDFGDGADRLVNGGAIRIGRRDAAQIVRIDGLERLDNRGEISLANGIVGDRLLLSGQLAGSNGGALALDVSLMGSGSADLVRAGSLAGTTEVRLNLDKQVGGLGLRGVTLVRAAGDVDGSELVLAPEGRNLGFVDFSLDFDAADNSWQLNGGLGERGYRTALAGNGARDLWREGVRAWSTQLALNRRQEDGLYAWTHALAGENDRRGTASTALGSRRIGWETDHDGMLFGIEKVAGDWRFGVAAGYGSADLAFGGGEESRFESVNAAAYAGYASNGWFGNVIVRADWLDTETQWGSVALDQEGEGDMVGAAIEAGYRADLGGFSIEPFASAQSLHVDLPDLASRFGKVRYLGGTSLAGEAGLRLEARQGRGGLPFEPSLTLALAVEDGGDEVDLTISGDRIQIEEDGTRSYGRAALGIARDFGPLRLFAQGEGRFGEIEGYSGQMGASLRF